jgi:hypothetical protein
LQTEATILLNSVLPDLWIEKANQGPESASVAGRAEITSSYFIVTSVPDQMALHLYGQMLPEPGK